MEPAVADLITAARPSITGPNSDLPGGERQVSRHLRFDSATEACPAPEATAGHHADQPFARSSPMAKTDSNGPHDTSKVRANLI